MAKVKEIATSIMITLIVISQITIGLSYTGMNYSLNNYLAGAIEFLLPEPDNDYNDQNTPDSICQYVTDSTGDSNITSHGQETLDNVRNIDQSEENNSSISLDKTTKYKRILCLK